MIAWSMSIALCLKTLLAFLLGLCIGFEREFHRSAAGIRTYAAVALGSCVFGLISTHAQGASYYQSVVDPTRIAAQIVTGIGFLGAGVIFRSGSKTSGLTTAATIWSTAAVGLAVAFDMFILAVFATLLIISLLVLNYVTPIRKMKKRIKQIDDDA